MGVILQYRNGSTDNSVKRIAHIDMDAEAELLAQRKELKGRITNRTVTWVQQIGHTRIVQRLPLPGGVTP
jgi:hypothetical protein